MARFGSHAVWGSRYREYGNSVQQTKLAILILGPAKGSPGYDKRVEIREHIAGLSEYNDVCLPEEIDRRAVSDLLPDKGLWTFLDWLIGQANRVFALLIDDIKVQGVLHELSRHESSADFRDKCYLIMPKQIQQGKASSPLSWEAAKKYSRDRKLLYSKEEFTDCHKIRDYVAAQVDLCRKRMRWGEFRENKGMSGP